MHAKMLTGSIVHEVNFHYRQPVIFAIREKRVKNVCIVFNNGTQSHIVTAFMEKVNLIGLKP